MRKIHSFICLIYLITGSCFVAKAQTTVIVNQGQSIQAAVNSATPGTTIRVTAGTYNQKVSFSAKSGTNGNFIILKADAGVILDGTGLVANGREGLITVRNSSYVRVDGFDIRNFITGGGQTPCGILVEGSGTKIQIVNNKIHNIRNNSPCKDPCSEGAHGLAVFGTTSQGLTDILLQGNEVYSNVLQASESVVVNGNVDRFEVLNNNAHDNNNIGFDFIGYEGECSGCGANDRVRNGMVRGNTATNNSSTTNPWYSNSGSAGGFYVDGGQYIVFDRNRSTGNDLGFEFASEHPGKATEDILMTNNFIYNNRDVGVALGGYASGLGEARRIQVYNNSFYKNKGFGTEVTFQYKVVNCRFANNIFFGKATAGESYESTGSGSTGNVWGTNIWWGTSNASTGLPGTKILSNPLYVAPAKGNLSISSSSPAINAGALAADITTWPSAFWDVYFPPSGNIPANGLTDIDNETRVINGTIDLGADEFSGGVVTIPNAPSSLTATANSSSQITINWTDNATNEIGFSIERSLSAASGFTPLTTVAANVTSYQNTGLASGTTYYYRVSANNSAGTSAFSNVGNATTTVVVTIPNTPSSLTATANSSSQITINWTDNATNETGFSIERSLSAASGFTPLTTVAANVTSYQNTGLASGTTYYYRISANNSAGTSAFSNVASATTTVVVTQSPYNGVVAQIPGVIQAENYDLGGQNVAYFDNTPANISGAYRTDAVDIEPNNQGNFNVDYVATDEWMEYTVNVNTAGTYTIDAFVATSSAGKSFRMEMDGAPLGNLLPPNTGGWQNWQKVSLSNINLTSGQKIFRIYATSTDLNMDKFEFSKFVVGNQAPTVSISTPANNASFTAPASITINANAADADGTVSKVEFFNGTTPLGTAILVAPYTYSWTNVAAGTYTITAKATDNAGVSTTSAAVTVTVNPVVATGPVLVYKNCNNDPGYVIALPLGTYITSQLVALGVSDKDISRISIQAGYQVITYTENNFLGTSQVYTSDQACLTSSNNNDLISSLKVTLLQNPTVALASPANNAAYTAPANINLSANATDPDGGFITKVEFYSGTLLLGTDPTAPYTYTWTNVAAGSYTFTAKATDNSGAVTTSSSAAVVISPVVLVKDACAAIASYVENNGYAAGSKVNNTNVQYECKPWPYSGWCNGAAWAYEPGVGAYWADAWTSLGSCQAAARTFINQDNLAFTAMPNPFTDRFTIQLHLQERSYVMIEWMNLAGEKLMALDAGLKEAGTSDIEMNVSTFVSGIYGCKVQIGNQVRVYKVVKL